MDAVVLRHRRSKTSLIVTTVLSVCFMGPFLYFCAWWSDFSPPFVWGGIILFVINLLMYLAVLYSVTRDPKGFHCTLTVSRFSSCCPMVSMGDSFDVALTDIQELVKSDASDSPSYYFRTLDGATYWISPNFLNPDRRFFDAIQKLRPDIATKVTHESVRRTCDEEVNLPKRSPLTQFLGRKRSFGISIIEAITFLFILGIFVVLAAPLVIWVMQLLFG